MYKTNYPLDIDASNEHESILGQILYSDPCGFLKVYWWTVEKLRNDNNEVKMVDSTRALGYKQDVSECRDLKFIMFYEGIKSILS